MAEAERVLLGKTNKDSTIFLHLLYAWYDLVISRQGHMVVKGRHFGVSLTGYITLISLSLSFFICKVGMIRNIMKM